MPANHSKTNRVCTILILSDKNLFQNVFVTLLRRVAKDVTSSLLSWHKRYDLIPQIFDVTANENARYKRNELECNIKTKAPILQIFGHTAYIMQKVRWHSTIYIIFIFHLQRLPR